MSVWTIACLCGTLRLEHVYIIPVKNKYYKYYCSLLLYTVLLYFMDKILFNVPTPKDDLLYVQFIYVFRECSNAV